MTDILLENRIDGDTDDGRDIPDHFGNFETALINIFGIPPNTAMSQAMAIDASTGNVTMSGTLSYAKTPVTNLEAANRAYVSSVGGGGSFGTYRAVAAMASNYTLSSAEVLYIPWDLAPVDTSEMWSSGDPTRLTVPADGEYMVGFNLYCDLTLRHYISVWRNRTTQIDLKKFQNDDASAVGMSAMYYFTELAEGDFIEFRVYNGYYGLQTIYAAYTTAWILGVG